MSDAPKLFSFDNTYAALPEKFGSRVPPTPVRAPQLIAFNRELAAELGMKLDGIDDATLAAVFAGNLLPEGAEPLAMAYAGHQFGGFVPQLGDGRAILLGEVVDRNGVRRDVQLKGPGRTPYSRGGDGRAAVGPVIREYLVSEAMHSLGIPTTRSLAAVATGEPVYRERPLPGAVVTRVAASHIRVGTFQFFAARGDREAIETLALYAIDRHYPVAREAANPYMALLEAVIAAQAELIARWMHVGFIHGVMNTDNTAISGETIDFGPCAFMDYYDPMKVFSSIDVYGRYAFGNQPAIAQWNLARFAETLLPLMDEDIERAIAQAEAMLKGFTDRFQRHYLAGMREKFGLQSDQEEDANLIADLLDLMKEAEADYTVTFRLLCDAAEGDDEPLRELFADREKIGDWLTRWRVRLSREPQALERSDHGGPASRGERMRRVNPAYIPRNHRIEEAIAAAMDRGDLEPMHRLHAALSDPYTERAEYQEYALPPEPSQRVCATFCGT